MAKVTIKVIPKSGRQEVKMDGFVIKVWLKSPPTDGQANEELIRILAKRFSVPKSCVEILSGFHAKTKSVDIMGKTLENIKKLLT